MKEQTKLVVLGRDSKANHGIVNPPVYHASTVLYPTVKDLESKAVWAGQAGDLRAPPAPPPPSPWRTPSPSWRADSTRSWPPPACRPSSWP